MKNYCLCKHPPPPPQEESEKGPLFRFFLRGGKGGGGVRTLAMRTTVSPDYCATAIKSIFSSLRTVFHSVIQAAVLNVLD